MALLGMPLNAHAAEQSNGNSTSSGDVYGKYVKAESAPKRRLEKGSAVVTVDGIHIAVSGAPVRAAYLRALTISDPAPWKWVRESVKKGYTPRRGFHIFMEDENGNKISAADTMICISPAEEEFLLALQKNGYSNLVHINKQGNEMRFRCDNSPYYILADKEKESKPDSKPDHHHEDPSNPKTEDSTEILFWMEAFTGSCLVLAMFFTAASDRNTRKW